MKKILSAVLAAMCIACGAVMTASADCTEHSYTNGFCTSDGCGAYEQPTAVTGKYDLDGDGTADADAVVYEIENAGQLYWFAGLVNGDTSVCDYDAETNPDGTQQNKAANAVVTGNSIKVNDNIFADAVSIDKNLSVTVAGSDNFREWTPIGNSKDNAYTGTFHGGGGTPDARNSIVGLYFNDKDAECAGLFGYIGEGGTVRNTEVMDGFFLAGTYTGGICGYNEGTLEKCYNLNYLLTYGKYNKTDSIPAYIGGICGYNEGNINYCYNNFQKDNAGGVETHDSVGTVRAINNTENNINNAPCIGGICGYSNEDGKISYCENKGVVDGYSSYYMVFNIGGICGVNNASDGEITNCSNLADITLNEYSKKNETSPYALYAGGVCGYSYGGKFEDNYNTADITVNLSEKFKLGAFDSYIGGVCGGCSVSVTNCYSNGNINIDASKLTSITNDYNKTIYIGGLNGYTSKSTNECKFCYSSAKITITDNSDYDTKFSDLVKAGGLTGLTDGTTVTSCYYDGTLFDGNVYGSISSSGITDPTAECKKTTAQFKSGEVAYLLQKDQPNYDGTNRQISVYGQSLASGAVYPYFSSGNTVYQTIGCTGGYSNTENYTKEHSEYKNGFCPDCGAYEAPIKNDDDVCEIRNAGQLYWFAGLVNGTLEGGAQNTEINAKLMDNITVNENLLEALKFDTNNKVTNGTDFKAWTPIGSSAKPYTGTFDGNNKTISGLYFNDTTASYVGLFGYIQNSVKVHDLGVVDTYINANEYVGGLSGRVESTSTNVVEIDNCYSEGTVKGKEKIGGLFGHVGVGKSATLTIKNSYSTADVTATSESGGGFCGFINDGRRISHLTIDNCYSTGTVSGKDYIGGFCGYNSGGSISNSYSTGDVTTTGGYNGGFCGYNTSEIGSINNCYSTGNVTTTGNSLQIGSFCSACDKISIVNCYSTGTVKNSNGFLDKFVSGFVTTPANCYYLASAETETSNGITGKTADQFASGEVAYLLNGSTSEGDSLAWGQTLTGESADKYPVLGGITVYQSTPCTLEYSNTEGVTKKHEHNLANEYVCACGDKLIKIVTSTNETTVPELKTNTVIYETDKTASDFKYDGTSTVTTVYVKIYNPTDDVKPVIKISGDEGDIESQTWTAVDGTNIYYAQFIGDFSQFGEIKVTYDGADDVTIDNTSTSEDE